jgi:hypothetical protein
MPFQKITTILEPSTEIVNELTLTTNKSFNYAAFVINMNQIKVTESGSLMADLPKESNINKVESILNKYHKNIPQNEILESKKDGAYRKFYTDPIGFTASKIERDEGITINIRADVASHLTSQGNLFIQCNQQMCGVFIPRALKLDYSKFTLSEVKR